MFEHVVAAHDVAFVLKTDDDSFVNVPALVADLWGRCTTADCAGAKLYMGYQVSLAPAVISVPCDVRGASLHSQAELVRSPVWAIR